MTTMQNPKNGLTADAVSAAARNAGLAIPPAWPLASNVAVNPFLGQIGQDLATTGAQLARVAGVAVTMPRHWYDAKISSGEIADQDLVAAMALAPARFQPKSLAALKQAAKAAAPDRAAIPTVADLSGDATGTDWPAIIAERFTLWAASRFDEGQALWAYVDEADSYAAWREFASHDRTPEIHGLSGFAAMVKGTPETADAAIARACATLNLSSDALEGYFHSLLMSLGGWSQLARYKAWVAGQQGESDDTMTAFLAIRLVWEEALYQKHAAAIEAPWTAARQMHAKPVEADQDHWIDAILQEAADRAAQRVLQATLSDGNAKAPSDRPALQAAFCIDVRSEVIRRALESIDPKIQTLGFAGFFGLATAHHGLASDVEEKRFPVLLTAAVQSRPVVPESDPKALHMRYASRAKRAWSRFKQAAVSSFAFVEAAGIAHGWWLVRDSLGMPGDTAKADPAPTLPEAVTLEQRIDAAQTILKAMSLTEGFAPVVIVAGHGAGVVNNPHESTLHCGACGGYSGEVNARLLAGLLNDAAVRDGLAGRGIAIPEDTVFVGALHNTTTDEVVLYDTDALKRGGAGQIDTVRQWLAAARSLALAERALRLPGAASEAEVAARASDWSQVRPEWGLAGCQAFIAAPRANTAGKTLGGRAFLHDYVWQKDDWFSTLELIMTAPVVVASWISLQYYGSVVAPDHFGGGNKLLHNVVGGFGVIEGAGSALRPGLPWQSVHDGASFAHDPLRLSVCIAAPVEAMNDILSRHDGVRALFDNRWLHLFALDENGRMAWRYAGDLNWEREGGESDPVSTLAA